jgi:hypothetical protein
MFMAVRARRWRLAAVGLAALLMMGAGAVVSAESPTADTITGCFSQTSGKLSIVGLGNVKCKADELLVQWPSSVQFDDLERTLVGINARTADLEERASTAEARANDLERALVGINARTADLESSMTGTYEALGGPAGGDVLAIAYLTMREATEAAHDDMEYWLQKIKETEGCLGDPPRTLECELYGGLQKTLDRQSKLLEIMSNVLKSLQGTRDSIERNIKP